MQSGRAHRWPRSNCKPCALTRIDERCSYPRGGATRSRLGARVPPPLRAASPSALQPRANARDLRATVDATTPLRRARPAPRAYGLHIGSCPASFVWSCPRCRSISSPLRGSSVSRPALSYVHALHQWRCYALPIASYVRVLPPSGVGRSPSRQRGRYGSSPIPRSPLPLRVRVARSPR